jgi:hypothetical protein
MPTTGISLIWPRARLAAPLLGLEPDNAVADMGAPDANRVATTQTRFPQNLERQPLTRPERPYAPERRLVFGRPGLKAVGAGPRHLDAFGRVGGDEAGFEQPPKEPAQRLDEVAGGGRC